MRGGPGRLGEGSRSLAKLALGSAPLDGSARSRGEDGPGNIGVGLEGARWRWRKVRDACGHGDVRATWRASRGGRI